MDGILDADQICINKAIRAVSKKTEYRNIRQFDPCNTSSRQSARDEASKIITALVEYVNNIIVRNLHTGRNRDANARRVEVVLVYYKKLDNYTRVTHLTVTMPTDDSPTITVDLQNLFDYCAINAKKHPIVHITEIACFLALFWTNPFLVAFLFIVYFIVAWRA